MKNITAVIISIIGISSANAQQAMSKQEFIDTQLRMVASAKQMQEDLGKRNRKMLKESLPKEDYERMMADEAQYEAEAKARTAECLNISEQELEAYENSFDTEFQLELINSCSAALPETITMNSMDWSENADLSEFQACTATEISKKTNISQKKLSECNEDSNY